MEERRCREISNILCRLQTIFYVQKSHAQTQVWPTTLNPKKDIFESEKLRYTALVKNLHYGDNISELDTISKIITQLLDILCQRYLIQYLKMFKAAIIDHIEFSTGSNVERYVIPECIKPIGLNITLKNGETIYSSKNEKSILKYILPSSSSFDGLLNDTLPLDEFELCDTLSDTINFSDLGSEIYHVYNNLYRNKFYLTRHARNLLNEIQEIEKQSVVINYQSEFFSGIEAIVLLPSTFNSLSEASLCCIDSLALKKEHIDILLEEIKNILASNTCVIICPSGFAKPIFKSNTNLNISHYTCIHGRKVLSSYDTSLISAAIPINPAINPKNQTINTLDFLIT